MEYIYISLWAVVTPADNILALFRVESEALSWCRSKRPDASVRLVEVRIG